MPSNPLPEADLQESIISAARDFGWLVGYTRNSRKCEPGEPDLRLAHPEQRRVVFIECKTETGRLTKGRWNKARTRWLPGQDEWLAALRNCEGVETYLVRPSDLEWVYQMLQGRPKGERSE